MSKSICILGLGYIGLPTALLFAKEGNTVLGVDIDQDKIQKLNQEILPFEETGLKKLYENAKHNFTASTSTKPSDVFLIAVPTPITKEKKCDLRYVVAATNSIKNHLKKGDLVILESTVRPRTTIDIVKPILEETGLICGQDFFLAYVPEKAIPGKTVCIGELPCPLRKFQQMLWQNLFWWEAREASTVYTSSMPLERTTETTLGIKEI